MFFIAYTFKGQVHVFAGRVKIVGHSSCRTSAIFKYFCPLISVLQYCFLTFIHVQIIGFDCSLLESKNGVNVNIYHDVI